MKAKKSGIAVTTVAAALAAATMSGVHAQETRSGGGETRPGIVERGVVAPDYRILRGDPRQVSPAAMRQIDMILAALGAGDEPDPTADTWSQWSQNDDGTGEWIVLFTESTGDEDVELELSVAD